MRAFAYVRVSTEEQADSGHSIELQPARITSYCQTYGLELVDVITDPAVSGSTPLARRAGGRELLRRLDAGEAEAVVVVRLDRLFRDALDGLQFFARSRAVVHSVAERIDTGSPAGRLQLTILLATAQYERDIAAARATENTRGLRAAGRVYGSTPYGCVAVAGQLYRDPATWAQRELICEWRANGLPLQAIRERLREDRVQAPGGGTWWSKSTLSNLIATHTDLAHLPELPAHGAPAHTARPDVEDFCATA